MPGEGLQGQPWPSQRRPGPFFVTAWPIVDNQQVVRIELGQVRN